MKKWLKALCVSLACMVSIGAVGCKEETPTETPETEEYEQKYEKVLFDGGTHVYTATETDKPFIKNGATDYVLVVPKETSETIKKAKEEFEDLFKKATGITIRTTKDTGLTHNENIKVISLGETTLLESSGVSVDKAELGYDGGRIVTKDNAVYIVGGTDTGTLYAVYTYMSITFHFEQYYWNCIQIDENVKNLNLKSYDVTDIPDMPIRTGGWFTQLRSPHSDSYDAKMMEDRFRLSKEGSAKYELRAYKDFEGTTYTTATHNTDTILPRATYQAEHPNWFSTLGNQLCYTARGDETEFELMAQEVAKKIEFALTIQTPEKFPYIESFKLGMEDNYDTCACEKCVELTEYYGTEAGAVCIFMNRVGELVEDWMNRDENAAYRRENFEVGFGAYNNYIDAPVKYDETTNSYVAIDDKVALRHNVCVEYIDIKMDYQSAMYSEMNDKTRRNLDGWASMTDNVDHYVYQVNYNNFMVFYDSFNYFNSETYQYLMERNARLFYICGGGNVETNWARLKLYVSAKLVWDCTLDQQTLIDNYFNAMFADAADEMKSLFNAQRAHMAQVCTQNNLYAPDSIYIDFDKAEYYPMNTLRSWLGIIDRALAIVKKYETMNPEYYELLREHIETEYIAPAYLLYTIHKDNLLTEEKNAIKQRILRILDEINVPDMLVKEWGGVTIAQKLS